MMKEGKTVRLSAVIFLIVFTALLACGIVYYVQQRAYQTAIEGWKSKNEQLSLEIGRLQKESESLAGEKRVMIQAKADRILAALKNKDMDELGKYVHPQKGLRFSPYTAVNTKTDLSFSAADIQALFRDTKIYHWGIYDGSGKPIGLSFQDYYAKFIYDQDFLAAPQLYYNQAIQRGNMINNCKEVYPEGLTMEYFFPGFEKQYEGMDWESLKLVFEPSGTDWYLVGIIHEQWTI